MNKVKSIFTRNNIIYLTIFAILLLSSYSGLADYDYYWQSTLGKYILQGDFYGVDKLTWGNLGKSLYLDHEWLTNILFYLSTLLGIKGITVLKILISLFIALTLVYYIKSENKEFNLISYLYLVVFLFILSVVFIKVKAYCISIGFLILETTFLKQYKKTEKFKYFIYMILLCLLWTNMHSGSVVLFFGVAGVFWLTNLFKNWRVLICGAVCFLVTFINPYGYKLLLFNLQHNGDSVMKRYVADWRALDAKTSVGICCVFIIFLLVLSLYKVNVKEHLFDIIMLAIIVFLSLQSIRHFVYVLPFFVSIILDNSSKIKLQENIVHYSAIVFIGICLLVNISAFTCKTYEVDYAMDYIDDDLKELLIKTNCNDSTGLYSDELYLWDRDIKSFTSGAFPSIRQRYLDSYLIRFTGSNSQIQSVIDYYGLTKFCFIKNNTLVDYYTVNCVLYEYLLNNDDYVCLYDSDYYCYFVKADLEY